MTDTTNATPPGAATDAAEMLRPVRPASLDSVEISDPTGSFYGLLLQLGGTLLLSADGSRLLAISMTEQQPRLTGMMLPDLRGLTVGDDKIVCAARNAIHVFKSVKPLAAIAPYAPNTYDAVYSPRTIHFTGHCHFHDMLVQGNSVVAVNTRYSCVCVIDGRHSFTPIWKPPFITRMLPEDRCHLNGMAIADGRLRYVTMLGMSDVAEGWRETAFDGGGVVMDAQSGAVVASGLSFPHSPRVLDGRLIVLESGRGAVVEIDPATGAKTERARLPGFAHGLVEHRGVLFIGVSKLRSRRPGQRLPIEQECEPICGIVALDARSFETLGMLEITSGLEEVYEVQVIPDVQAIELRSAVQAHQVEAIELPGQCFWSLSRPPQAEGEAAG